MVIQQQEWFTVDEAAGYLRVSRRTIYKLCADGYLLGHRSSPRGHRRFRKEELDELMKGDIRESDTDGLLDLTALADPVLADIWDNERDAAYDRV
jgi:excisionase family DNA binding protein